MVRITPQAALERRRFGLIKEAISVPTLAQDLTGERGQQLKKQGDRWRGLCVLCGNGSHSRAFSASDELWHCFSCGKGGDLIDLANFAGDFDSASFAVAWLAHRYGVDLPERPDSWYRKQDRQARVRERVEAERREIKRRRLFKYLILPELEKVPVAERAKETAVAWESFKKMPLTDRYGDARG